MKPDRERNTRRADDQREQSPGIWFVDDHQVGIRSAQVRRKPRSDRNRAGLPERANPGDRDTIDDIFPGRSTAIEREDAALQPSARNSAERFNHSLHAARDRRIVLADVQHPQHFITPRGFAPRTPLHARSSGPASPTPLAWAHSPARSPPRCRRPYVRTVTQSRVRISTS